MGQTLAFLEFALSLIVVLVLKVVCFILGYLTVRLGHQLISAGVKGEFKFSARLSGTGADLASASPGLLFILLGVRNWHLSTCLPEAKPYCISKKLVLRAWQLVKANRGAAGVDEETLSMFEKDLKGNLYKIWNRMSSGSYLPPPVR
jgi:hypothetical protein